MVLVDLRGNRVLDGTTALAPVRAVASLVVVVALLGILAGCAASTDTGSSTPTTSAGTVAADDGPPRDGGALTIGVPSETDGWNPRVTPWGNPGALVGSSVLENLVWFDADAQPQPWLAESVTANAAHDVWTIRVRPNVRFHNGEVLDAAAVKQNLENVKAAAITNLAYGSLLDRFDAVDDRTVEAHLTQPWSAFPAMLAASGVAMLAPEMMAAADQGTEHPIGTGPFVFTSWTRDTSFKASKNPTYWRPGEPHLDAIQFKVLVDQSTQANALRSGDVNMIFNTNAEASQDLDPGFQVIREWTTQPQEIVTNTFPELDGQPNPAANQHLRVAMASATDRAQVAAAAGDGIGSPTSPFAADGPWGQPDDQNGFPAFDVERATREVAAYQAETGAGPPRVTVKYANEPRLTRVLQVLQQQWKAAGIELSLEAVEAAAFINQLVGGDFQLAVLPIYTSPDPDSYYLFWSSANAKGPGALNLNFAQHKSQKIDDLLDTGRQSSDPATRKQAYSDIVREINAQGINIWLYWTPYTMIADPTVRGLGAIEQDPFADYEPKTWYGRLWVAA